MQDEYIQYVNDQVGELLNRCYEAMTGQRVKYNYNIATKTNEMISSMDQDGEGGPFAFITVLNEQAYNSSLVVTPIDRDTVYSLVSIELVAGNRRVYLSLIGETPITSRWINTEFGRPFYPDEILNM